MSEEAKTKDHVAQREKTLKKKKVDEKKETTAREPGKGEIKHPMGFPSMYP